MIEHYHRSRRYHSPLSYHTLRAGRGPARSYVALRRHTPHTSRTYDGSVPSVISDRPELVSAAPGHISRTWRADSFSRSLHRTHVHVTLHTECNHPLYTESSQPSSPILSDKPALQESCLCASLNQHLRAHRTRQWVLGTARVPTFRPTCCDCTSGRGGIVVGSESSGCTTAADIADSWGSKRGAPPWRRVLSPSRRVAMEAYTHSRLAVRAMGCHRACSHLWLMASEGVHVGASDGVP